MTDLDKGAALLHWHKACVDGSRYATAEYPARYFDDPALAALDKEDASAHARQVANGKRRSLHPDEWQRLYDGALDEVERRYREARAAVSDAG
jgi:hypothetical protein